MWSLGGILEHKQDINGKTSELQTKSSLVNSDIPIDVGSLGVTNVP